MGLLSKIFKAIFNKRLIYQDKTERMIRDQEIINFSSHSSWHLIVITARAKGEKQLGEDITNDEDLTVKIDNKTFPKINSSGVIDSPAAFSGGKLHDSAKTIYFLTFLYGTEHTITLLADDPPNTATFEGAEIYIINDLKNKFITRPDIQAKDINIHPWLVFVLDNLPLRFIKTKVTYFKRKHDSDDVKVRIDGKIQTELISNIKRWLWKFSGSRLTWESPIKTQTQRFWPKLKTGLHYIEFDVDRMPILHKIVIGFGKKPPIPEPPTLIQTQPKRIPTVDDPIWTGDFRDDTEQILLARLIFGEARNQPREAKIWIAGAVINRVKAGAWPNRIREVILQPAQYDPFKSSDPNYLKIINPFNFKGSNDLSKRSWDECYEIAQDIISGKLENPTEATHFHGIGITRNKFEKAIVPKGTFLKRIGNTHFYWSPN